MAERVYVWDLANDEGQKLLSIVRRSSGSVVRWRRAQIVLWSAQRMDVPAIAKIAFTSEDRVRAVIHNFNDDGFDSLAPKYAGGRPPTFTLPQRREIKKIALARPTDHDLPFSTWSLSKLTEFLVAEGAPIAAGNGDSESPRRRRMRATYTRPHGVRHLMAGYDLSTNRLYGHVVKNKGRTAFLAFCRYLRSLHPPEVRIAIVLDNFSPHLSTKKDGRVGDWAGRVPRGEHGDAFGDRCCSCRAARH